MSLTPIAVQRVFLYNGRTLPDPDPRMSPEQVKQFYSAIHADLTNAAVGEGRFEGETQTFEFKRGIGTKG
jgi:PRTRC genetic system protein C